MAEIVRTVRLEERDTFERFLERCYGCSWGAFRRWGPDVFRDDEEAMQWHLALELDGRIVSHVAGYPREVVVGPARAMMAGVGNVATHPDHRGQGFMSRLMEESVRRWRERGWTLSALWGDRQRYINFGWETCGFRYTVTVTRRSLERNGIEAAEIEEVNPADPQVAARVGALHATLPYRIERPHLALQLRREGVRVFLGPDGYLLSRGNYGDTPVTEVVSSSGREPELIAGALNRTFANAAQVEMGAGEGDRLARVVRAMSGWHTNTQGMLRILNWPGLLRDLRPFLTQRAAGLPPFRTCIGCRWRDETEWATVSWDGEALDVEGRREGEAVEADLPTLTGIVLGSPHPVPEGLGPFARLLPVPVHVPALDRV